MVLKDFDSYCDLYGYTSDKKLSGLNDILKHDKLEKLHISIYTKEPYNEQSELHQNEQSELCCNERSELRYTLLLRTEANNARIAPDDNRLIIKSGGVNKSTIMNIFKKDIDECIYKKYTSDNSPSYYTCRYEIIFSLGKIFYRMFALVRA